MGFSQCLIAHIKSFLRLNNPFKKRLKNKLNLDKNRLKKVDFFSKKQTIFTIPIHFHKESNLLDKLKEENKFNALNRTKTQQIGARYR
jgi:hypothetical protein